MAAVTDNGKNYSLCLNYSKKYDAIITGDGIFQQKKKELIDLQKNREVSKSPHLLIQQALVCGHTDFMSHEACSKQEDIPILAMGIPHCRIITAQSTASLTVGKLHTAAAI